MFHGFEIAPWAAAVTDLGFEQAVVRGPPAAVRLSLSGAVLARMLGGGAGDPDKRLAISLPFVIRKRGVETKLVLGGVQAAEPDPALICLLADAQCWMRRLLTGEGPRLDRSRCRIL